MEIADFFESGISIDGSSMVITDLSTVIFLSDVSNARNWDGKFVKPYKKGEIDNDFDPEERAYKAASIVFMQMPHIQTFKVGRRDSGQSVVDALDIVEQQEKSRYCLFGTRSTEILQAAPWIEQRRMIQIACLDDEDIMSDSTTDLASQLKAGGYHRSMIFRNEQAGKTILGADLSVASGVCTVTTPDGPQTDEITVTDVVEGYTYQVTVDSNNVDHVTEEYYHQQIDKVTVTLSADSYDYQVSIAGHTATYRSGVGETLEAIKTGLRAAVNADPNTSAIVTAIINAGDPVDTFRTVGKNDYETYPVVVGGNLSTSQVTTPVEPSKTELATSIRAAINADPTVSAIVTAMQGMTGERIKLVEKVPGTGYTLAVSANLSSQNIPTPHGLEIGDPITNFKAVEVGINGNKIITAVPAPNQFQFETTAVDGAMTPGVEIDAGYVYPDGGLAGMVLGHQAGEIDACHKNIVGIKPTPDTLLTSEAVKNMNDKNVSWFHLTGGKRLFWEGKMASGVFMMTIVDMDYLITKLDENIFDFVTGQKKTPMTNPSMTSLKAVMTRVFETEGKDRGITAPFIEDFAKYPDTGLPPGARPGDHYVIRMPDVADLPIAERQAGKVIRGITYDFQMSGGIHVIKTYGNLLR